MIVVKFHLQPVFPDCDGAGDLKFEGRKEAGVFSDERIVHGDNGAVVRPFKTEIHHLTVLKGRKQELRFVSFLAETDGTLVFRNDNGLTIPQKRANIDMEAAGLDCGRKILQKRAVMRSGKNQFPLQRFGSLNMRLYGKRRGSGFFQPAKDGFMGSRGYAFQQCRFRQFPALQSERIDPYRWFLLSAFLARSSLSDIIA